MKRVLMLLASLSSLAVAAYAFDASAAWNEQCAKCHGKDGKGQTKIGEKLGIKDFTDAKVQAEFKDEQAHKAIKEGLRDKDGKLKMKAAEGLSDDEIKALVKHVREFKK